MIGGGLPQVVDVPALLATELAIPRLLLIQVTRVHPVTAVTTVGYYSDAPYATEPTDTVTVAFEPRIMDGWSFEWSRVAGADARSGDGPTMSGRASINRGTIVLSNHDGGLDSWLTDGAELTTVVVWYGTYKEYGVSFSEIEKAPVFNGYGANPVREGNNTIEFDIEGVETKLDGVDVREATWLGYGPALSFISAATPTPASIAHNAVQVATTSLEVRALVWFDLDDIDQVVVAKGALAVGWVLFRRSANDIQFDFTFDSSIRGRARTSGTIASGQWLDIRGTWRASDDRVALWINGEIVGTDTQVSQTYTGASHTEPITVGHDGSGSTRYLDGMVAGLEIRIDQDRSDVDIAADEVLAPLPSDALTTPTLSWQLYEYPLAVAYSDPTEDGHVFEMALNGAVWVDTRTGDRSLRGTVLPTVLGQVDRASAPYSLASMGVRTVHGGNGATGNTYGVAGMGPADDAGVAVLIDRASPWTSTTCAFDGVRIIGGATDDFAGLRAGQDIEVATTGGQNQGRRTLALDSTVGEFVVTGAAFTTVAAGVAGTVTISVAGKTITSTGIEFRAGRNELAVPDIEANNYLDGYGTSLVLGNTGGSDGTYNPTSVAPGVIVLDGSPSDMSAGREITLKRVLTYAANVVTLRKYAGVTTRSYFEIAPGNDVPPLGDLKVGSTIVFSETGSTTNDGTYTVTAPATSSYGPRVTPNFPTGGLVTNACTLTVTESTTLATIAVTPQLIVSHDRDTSFAGLRAGGSVEVTAGGGGNNGDILTILDGATAETLPVSESLSDEPAGSTVTLEVDAAGATDITVDVNHGEVVERQPYGNLAIAVRQSSKAGGDLVADLLGNYARLTSGQIKLSSLTAWASADPHPRGIQILEPMAVMDVLDLMVAPSASWGSHLGDRIEVYEHPDLTGSVDAAYTDSFGITPTPVMLPARKRPILGIANMVVVDPVDVPASVRTASPRLVAIMTQPDQTFSADITTQGVSVVDPPVRTAYATVAGLRYAHGKQAALYGVARQVWEIALPPSIMLVDWRGNIVSIQDVDHATLSVAVPGMLLGVRVGASRIIHQCEILV